LSVKKCHARDVIEQSVGKPHTRPHKKRHTQNPTGHQSDGDGAKAPFPFRKRQDMRIY